MAVPERSRARVGLPLDTEIPRDGRISADASARLEKPVAEQREKMKEEMLGKACRSRSDRRTPLSRTHSCTTQVVLLFLLFSPLG